MIKIGKMTDYAIAVMGSLSTEGEEVLRSARYLSGKTSIPESTVAKVLKLLTQAGLVESLRGVSGGYRLAKPAGEITVAEMVTAMEGPISIVSCIEGSDEGCCKVQAHCPTKENWTPVNDAIRRALQSVSLAELVSRAPCATAQEIPVVWMKKR